MHEAKEIDEMFPMMGVDDEAPIDEKRLPVLIKVFGVLCVVVGALNLSGVVLGIVDAVGMLTAGELGDELASLVATAAVLTVALFLICVIAIAYGVSLLRNKRRRAAIESQSLLILAFVAIVCGVILYGALPRIIPTAVTLVFFLALNSYIDPSLTEERQSRRRQSDEEVHERAEAGTLGRDETGKGFITLNFFNLFWIFVVGSFVGLVGETIYHAIVFGGYESRAGLLFGPFSSIYGVGAVLMTMALNRFHKRNVLLVFLLSAVIGGAFEYFASWAMEVAFGVVAWDYTGTFLSIGGRTNGYFMCIWGLAGVLWIKIALPALLRLINGIPWNWRYAVTVACAVLMTVNVVMTVQALDCWGARGSGRAPEAPMEEFYAQYFDDEFMSARFGNMSVISQ